MAAVVIATARINTIKNLINPAVMPGYSEIAGMAINAEAASNSIIVDNIPARSILAVSAQSQVTADGSVPVAVSYAIADGTKAGTKKVTFTVVASSTLSYIIKYSESEVIAAETNTDDSLTLSSPLQ
jgi:hypothetical protein